MDELVAFLRARQDEDEAAAKAGISSQSDPENGWGYITDGVSRGALTPHVGIIHEAVQAAHIIRWHPARVLAEVEAKRRIIDEAEHGCAGDGEYTRCAQWSDNILRLLALPFADHDDYDESWRP